MTIHINFITFVISKNQSFHIIPFSSQTFEGVEEVRNIIEDIANEDEESE